MINIILYHINRTRCYQISLAVHLYEEHLALLLQELFLLIYRNRHENNVETSIQKEIVEAARFFSDNYNKEINVSNYARDHFFSSNYFTKNFKQYTGLTPTQYITSIRINNAQSMLSNFDYPINEIVQIVGYSDPLYFSRIFKKHVGYSPKEYRDLLISDEKAPE